MPKKSFEDPFITRQEMEEIFEEMEFYVAIKGERIVGVAALDVAKNNTGKIRWIYVLPKYQRQGIGKNLIRRIEQESRNKGVKELSVYHVLKEANWARKFYSSLGYEAEKGTTHPHGECLIYEKAIK
ncbi:MAG: GNAT family N-acetyltransferase [Candidatus Hadarchaeia archaeon]